MSVNNISATTATSSQNTATTASGQMGEDDFLKLLVAQIKNQDPMSPVDNATYMAQLAQFSSLDQLTNLNSSMGSLVTLQQNSADNNSLLFAVNMLGKNVEATDPDTNTTYSGKVQGYQVKDKEIYFTVNGTEIPASWISSASLADSEAS
ncbi:MAG: flagellar hook capping FlgD N-terminal domain-containing protein [Thermacetogeniaceae bacterium]